MRRIIGPTICCCVLLVAAVGLAAVDAAGEILLVELISQERPEFQVTGTARLTYQASSDQWLPVRDLVLTPERTWSVAMEPGTGNSYSRRSAVIASLQDGRSGWCRTGRR